MFRNAVVFKRWCLAQSSRQVLDGLKNQELIRTNGYINGKWVESSSGETFAVTDPAIYPKESAFIAEVSSMSVNDYETAIQAAHDSFKSFKKTTGRYRSELLLNLYRLMIENQDDLAKLIVLENGKPYADALGEVKYAASFFQWFSEEAPRIGGDVIDSQNYGNKIITLKQPVGVAGILTPWNFPSAMITRKLAAAVSTGCTTVIKPASETPLSALLLAYLAEKAGFPAGVVNVLPSHDSSGVGRVMCEHPLVKKVSFTGSTNVGKLLMSQSSSTLKKLSFELGGNAPFIVFEDADVDAAITGALISKFRSSGQTCVCANRIFVHESVYDEFTEKFVKLINEKTKLGYGLEEGITHGPVIHDRSFAKVRSHIDDAISKGAKLLAGGNPRPDLGENFHELTILGDVTSDMLISQEETFGPVAPIIKFSTEEEVIQFANDTDVGLAGYFFSRDVGRIFRVAEDLEVGMIGVNTGAISESALPFGGIKHSGFGREGSKYGADEYTVVKSVVLGGIR
ncbi:succinate-semialdehyde dehydrogenase NADP+ dependent [Suhomyces tanzawaensis NRRL Y-17324]|uniref:Succinate-semialdehyde dehydrogenase n=1 Tax=Suhomyces tanzawaensis NRRL Y-17324 TaxID=984487 RepID=A0A1E4SCY9_9ASCO|nr:succinate-semialdehyde dehydrogenase NADP+ dependent [Suhomyces tanzawaensis NRRL Y-17324]ODV77379.1 succinate-semialdehyde dehydrogenase NADP+ dependent [Suhomyces tanzawaensis NRRL Y-17324]